MFTHRLKVLIVDDDEDDYIMTRDLLSESKDIRYELEWASTYDAALETIRGKTHDVYLFDYRLGEHTGLDLLQTVMADGCTTPVILLTGQGDHEVDLEAMNAGASDYLVKGQIDTAHLERSIRYAIGHKKSQEQIRRMAYYDPLTNLANRVLFQDRLSRDMAIADRDKKTTAVLFIDLDNFKRINDTLGHRVGDLLLKEVAARLTRSVRKCDSISRTPYDPSGITVARMGGDEFTVLLTHVQDSQNAARAAQRIIDALSKSYVLEDAELFITASIGIAIYPSDGNDMDSLLKNADAAMYHAKAQGRNNYQFYRKAMNETAFARFVLENDMHRGLERSEFIPHYQPQIELSGGTITGVEVLLQWQHPERGMLSAAEFIPLAEEIGFIIPLGEWVLRNACEQTKKWQEMYNVKIPVSVNLSVQQFRQKGFVAVVADVLKTTDLPAEYLILEITESIIMENTEEISNMLKSLTAMGIRFSMDGFGTGYSSLSYLKRIPLHAIKIDQSFVKDVTTNPDDAAIVKAIIAMAHSLNLKVIAEGVETEQQLAYLREQKCDEAQGYLVGYPVSEEAMTKFLTNKNLHSQLLRSR